MRTAAPHRVRSCKSRCKCFVPTVGDEVGRFIPQPRHPHPLLFSDPLDVYRQHGFQCDLCCETFTSGPMYHCERAGCTYDECVACHEEVNAQGEAEGGDGAAADEGAGLGLGLLGLGHPLGVTITTVA